MPCCVLMDGREQRHMDPVLPSAEEQMLCQTSTPRARTCYSTGQVLDNLFMQNTFKICKFPP